jgi:hypothetical protein
MSILIRTANGWAISGEMHVGVSLWDVGFHAINPAWVESIALVRVVLLECFVGLSCMFITGLIE